MTAIQPTAQEPIQPTAQDFWAAIFKNGCLWLGAKKQNKIILFCFVLKKRIFSFHLEKVNNLF